MRTPKIRPTILAILTLAALGSAALAQAPPPPPPPSPPPAGTADKPAGDALAQEAESKPKEPDDKKEKYHPLTGKVAAGFTFTSGNGDTRSLNLALALQYDPRTKNVVKADAFYLRNTESGASSVDRTSAHLRDERRLEGRWFAFGDVQYLRDRFKEIDFLLSPTVGIGAFLLKTEQREFSADLGVGAVLEKDAGLPRTSSGAVRAGESFLWKISKSANFTENAFALWKTRDTADAYYHFDVALGAAIDEHLELKVALIDEYKQKPPDPAIKKNDVAGIVSIGYKL